MCGIAGIFQMDHNSVDFSTLRKMTDVQRHRGPDDQGFAGFSFFNENISAIQFPSDVKGSYQGGIGFNRLSILDLSEKGHQPMISKNGKTMIAYNGETYNAFDLKPGLEKKGYHFQSHTDTEVLLYLYEEYGIPEMLKMLNGMFAFCIADVRHKKLFLARDHAGIKPMYWYRSKNTVLFASEIKSFFYYPGFKAEIDHNHVDEYLYYKYCAHDRTLFRGVYQIPPGQYLEITGQEIKLVKYWEPELCQEFQSNPKELTDALEQVFMESVRSQLISDVKVGCQLSGGIDSSLVTTYARNYLDSKLETFSIIPENSRYSEEKYIDQVIKLTQPLAHKFLLTPDWFAGNLVKATWHNDVPLPIPQAVGIKRMAEGSSSTVKVLLSGEGSDELMGGYVQHYNQAFKIKNQMALSLLSHIPFKGEKIKKQFLTEIIPENFFIRHRSAVHLYEFMEFRPEADLERIFGQRKQLYPDYPDLLKAIRVYDMRGWLVNLLNIQDKMMMAHSIENRVPFLDKKLIDFVLSLPSEYFIRGTTNLLKYNQPQHYTKILLKKLARRNYPDEFVYRTKMGFNQPLPDYYKNKIFTEMVNDSILPGIKNRGILNYPVLKKTWESIQGKENHPGIYLFWTSFSFELWAQVFVDRSLWPEGTN